MDAKPTKQPLIADAAPGSWLADSAPAGAGPPESLNVTDPERVRACHRAFRDAGATLLRTNTRGAARPLLEPYGLGDRCEAINNSGSALLREVVGPNGLVMGAIGRIPAHGPGGEIHTARRERGYAEQVVYLSDTGATFLLLEHFDQLEEALLVIRLARSASDARVLLPLRLGGGGRTPDGLTAAEAGARAVEAGAGAVGVGCGTPLEALQSGVEALLPLGVPVAVLAGVPSVGGEPAPRAAFLQPTAFAGALAPLAAGGAAILGGCCGVGPEHIRALAARFAPPGGETGTQKAEG